MGGPALGGPLTGRGAGATSPVRVGSIAILGGTFDPFHPGHLALARAARDQLGLERVLRTPAREPPHTLDRPISPPETPLRMVETGNPREPRLDPSAPHR